MVERKKVLWRDAVKVWEDILYSRDSIKFNFKKYGSKLYEKLFALDEELSTRPGYNSEEASRRVREIINSHIVE